MLQYNIYLIVILQPNLKCRKLFEDEKSKIHWVTLASAKSTKAAFL
jgi:hypothetical protein